MLLTFTKIFKHLAELTAYGLRNHLPTCYCVQALVRFFTGDKSFYIAYEIICLKIDMYVHLYVFVT